MSLFEERGIGFLRPREAMNITTIGDRIVFRILGALAQFERDLIRERTLSGLQAARARGRRGGKPKALDDDQLQLAYKLSEDREHTVKQICEQLSISKMTLYNYLRHRGVTIGAARRKKPVGEQAAISVSRRRG